MKTSFRYHFEELRQERIRKLDEDIDPVNLENIPYSSFIFRVIKDVGTLEHYRKPRRDKCIMYISDIVWCAYYISSKTQHKAIYIKVTEKEILKKWIYKLSINMEHVWVTFKKTNTLIVQCILAYNLVNININ